MSRAGRPKQRAPRFPVNRKQGEAVEVEPRVMKAAVVEVPTISHLVSDGLAILRREFVKLRESSNRPEELSEKQTKKFARYVRAVADLAKEEREQAAVDMGDMTDEAVITELLSNPDMRDMIIAHLRALGGKDER